MFESFNDYIDQVETLINQEVKKAVVKSKNLEQAMLTNPSWEPEYDIYQYEVRQKRLLQYIYYDSLIITIYSFVEKQMAYVCEQLGKAPNSKQSGINHYRSFLQSCKEKIDFTSISNDWKMLLKYNTLRNHLVHDGGFRVFAKTNLELYKALSSFSSLEIIDHKFHWGYTFKDNLILKTFCSTAHQIIDHLFFAKEERK